MAASDPARHTSWVLDSSRGLPSSWNHAHTQRAILHRTPSPDVSSVCVSCLYPSTQQRCESRGNFQTD